MKIRLYTIYFALIVLMFALSNCSPQNELEGRMMPVHITIPVDGAMTRTIGDPGAEPAMNLPTYAYLFLVTYQSEADAANKQNGTCSTTAISLQRDKWQYNEDKSNPSEGIVIYDYTGGASVYMQKGIHAARVYVAVSNGPLFENSPRPTTEDEILNLTFDFPSKYFEGDNAKDELNDFLKNLYTTPYNLTYTDLKTPYDGFNGKYYGTLLDANSNVPRIDIICYHVAAKLDVIWNVADDAQATKKVTSVAATGLNSKKCALFNPTNEGNNAIDGAYKQNFVAETTPGNEWYGRASVYVIQKPSAKYGFAVGVNGTEKTETVSVTYVGNTYTPWMRGFITVK